ncbi:uncharacterized protein LOC126976642 [Leptidea sinapis]|uniref:Vitellogenin domain-containing protein n=1 Tax=Leptidea sinapis TaxID=189913 RepID=A0A5E4QLR1_9NEOP|nr:uncharacterized protein LOC126976642 [Leptidea sinapis]VVC99254.1 unnamed protein product [Leptidea sinapis]
MRIQLSFISFFIFVIHVNSLHYDQSQSGDLNVQVDLKDLQIIALMKGGKEEYVDYDYAYDYSEMTIKPQNRTTPRPFNASITVLEPVGTRDNKTTTPQHEVTTNLPIKTQNTAVPDITESTMAINDYITTVSNNADSMNVSTGSINKNDTDDSNSQKCKRGFVLNRNGDCELKLHGSGNALLKLVKLSQKLKLRRENKTD